MIFYIISHYQKQTLGQLCWCISVIPVPVMQRQEDQELDSSSLGYIARPCVNKNKRKRREVEEEEKGKEGEGRGRD